VLTRSLVRITEKINLSVTQVQHCAQAAFSGVSSIPITSGQSYTANNMLILFIRCGGTTVSSITDSQGNTYSKVTGARWGASSARDAEVWSCSVSTSGVANPVITFAATSTMASYVTVAEYASPVGGVGCAATAIGNANTDNPVLSGITSVWEGSMLIANLWDSNDSLSSSLAIPNGWTIDTNLCINNVGGGSGWANIQMYNSYPMTAPDGRFGFQWVLTTPTTIDDWAMDLVVVTL
jgi:hypothetical protein